MSRRLEFAIYALSMAVFSVVGFYTWKGKFALNEYIGFVTGAVCVWLCVKENIWNWPIGLVNSAAYFVVFHQAALYADRDLQVMYFVLGILGWYWWLHGGKNKDRLQVSPMDFKTGALLCLFVGFGTWGWMVYLVHIHDAAPFLDALTSISSIAAQYLITKKHIENWHVWIAVDIIYVYLYLIRSLYLTSAL